MSDDQDRFVLASASGIRLQLLREAGFQFSVDPADLDERAIEAELSDPADLAQRLAREKALLVSERRPGALVLGADQVFSLDGDIVPKPENAKELRAKLESLSGRTHCFDCGFAFVRDGEVLHEGVDRVRVSFHELTEDEIDRQVASGEGLGCAGAYRLESGGVRMIRAIEGSHFTVLGLPMLSLVSWLGRSGEMATVLGKKES